MSIHQNKKSVVLEDVMDAICLQLDQLQLLIRSPEITLKDTEADLQRARLLSSYTETLINLSNAVGGPAGSSSLQSKNSTAGRQPEANKTMRVAGPYWYIAAHISLIALALGSGVKAELCEIWRLVLYWVWVWSSIMFIELLKGDTVLLLCNVGVCNFQVIICYKNMLLTGWYMI